MGGFTVSHPALDLAAEIHEVLAESNHSELTHAFAEIERLARAGWYTFEDIEGELEYQLKHEDGVDESGWLKSKLATLEGLVPGELIELHYEAGEAISADLPQSPIAYLIDALPESSAA